MKRIQLNKLTVSGENLEDAVIVFAPGLNIISGDSDTGKTYILKSIDYVLGGEEPKNIEEAKGYNKYSLDFSIDGICYKLTRIIGDSFCNIEHENQNEQLRIKYVKEDEKCLSNYLVNLLLNTYDISIGTSTTNDKTNRVTIRELLKYSIVEETEVIKEQSNLLSDNPANYIKSKRMFQYMISEISSSYSPEAKTLKEKRDLNNGGVRALLEVISQNEATIKELSFKITDDDPNELNKTLNGLVESLNTKYNELKINETKLYEVRLSIFDLYSQKSNMEKLKDSYKKRLKTSNHIITYNQFLENTPDLACPVCNSTLPRNINKDDYLKLNEQKSIEIQRIRYELNEIDKNIFSIDNDLNTQEIKEKEFKTNIDEIKKAISVLEASIDETKKRYENVVNVENDKAIIYKLSEQNEKLKCQIQELEKPIPKETNELYQAEFNDMLVEFNRILRENLVEWKVSNGANSFFDSQKLDVVIGEKSRDGFGKGYRSFLTTAIYYSLLNYCLEKNKPHIGFLIVDSPLVSFKESKLDPDGRLDSTFMDKAMVESMARTNGQVIIMENKNLNYSPNCNYIEFGKKDNMRHGFFIKK